MAPPGPSARGPLWPQYIVKNRYRSLKLQQELNWNEAHYKMTGNTDTLTSREDLICSSFRSYCTTTKSNNHLYLILVCMKVQTRDQVNGDVEEERKLQRMSFLVRGFNLCKLMMEAHIRLFIGPPVALCHSTSSLPLSLSTTLCWKPLP